MSQLRYLLILIFLLSTDLLFAQDVQETLNKAIQAYNSRDYRAAQAYLGDVIEKNPNHDEALYLLGRVNADQSKLTQALKYYNQAIAANPQKADYVNQRGWAYYYAGKYAEAVMDFEDALSIDNLLVSAYIGRGNTRYNSQLYKEAIADYYQALQLDPNNKTAQSSFNTVLNTLTLYHPNYTFVPADQKVVTLTSVAPEPAASTQAKPPAKTVVATTPLMPDKKPAETSQSTADTTPTTASTSQVTNRSKKDIGIVWISPDPNEYPNGYMSESEDISIKLKVLSDDNFNDENFVVYLNGKPYNQYGAKFQERSLRPGNKSSTYNSTIRLQDTPDHINTISVRVSNKTSGSGTSQELKVVYNPQKPQMHILAIGPKALDLQYNQKDAQDFAQLFQSQATEGEAALFTNVHVKTLTGADATSVEIRGMIEEYRYTHDIYPRDVVLLFISSHGFIDNNEFRLKGSDYDPLRKRTTSVSYQRDVVENLASLNCKKFVFLDACQSGGAKGDSYSINSAIRQIGQKLNDIITLTSSDQNQLSYEDAAWENGAFTEAIIRGMQHGFADTNGDRFITMRELINFVKTEVPQMVIEVKNELQTPTVPTKESNLFEIPFFQADY